MSKKYDQLPPISVANLNRIERQDNGLRYNSMSCEF